MQAQPIEIDAVREQGLGRRRRQLFQQHARGQPAIDTAPARRQGDTQPRLDATGVDPDGVAQQNLLAAAGDGELAAVPRSSLPAAVS